MSGDPDNDPDYPRQTGNRRSIGEVGIDTGTTPPTLYGPRRTVDVMAYANNGEQRWVSPYTYEAILEARGRHQSAPADPRRVRPVLVLDLRLHRSTEVEVRLLSRIDAPGPTPTPGDRAVSPLSLDLLDRDGRVLRTHHCWWTPPAACGCGCGRGEVPVEREPWLDLHEAVEWDEDCASIVLHRGDEPLLTVEVGEPPSVHIEGPEHVDDRLVARVVARHERERPSVVVLVTGDDGRTWAPVAVDPPDGEVSLDPALLPGGACRLRAVATAELCTAEAETETFELPRRGRRLHLRLPDRECPVAEGPVVLSAVLDTGGHGRPRDEEVVWRSDREGELGRGLRIVAELGPGEHEITVTAPDGVGDDAEQRGIIVVGGRDR